MKIRHRIIKWLSCGDMILMNISVQANGYIAPKECGDIVVLNSEFRLLPEATAIFASNQNNSASAAHIKIMTYGKKLNIQQASLSEAGRAALAQGGGE